MTDPEILRAKAKKNNTMCISDTCPLRQNCLHRIVADYVEEQREHCVYVNHRTPALGTNACPFHRPATKVRMAKGMTRIYTDDMPRRVEHGVRHRFILRYNRTYYFEYRNGTRLISPALQQEIRKLFRSYGWTGPVEFDSYVEVYEW